MFTIGLPKWAMESTDPYVMRLVEESYLEGVGHVREFFDELIAGGACQDALLMQRKEEQDRRLYKSAYDDDDEIARRAHGAVRGAGREQAHGRARSTRDRQVGGPLGARPRRHRAGPRTEGRAGLRRRAAV